jgi:hypothetical protein
MGAALRFGMDSERDGGESSGEIRRPPLIADSSPWIAGVEQLLAGYFAGMSLENLWRWFLWALG